MKIRSIQLKDFEKELNPITSDTSGDIYKVTKIENGKYYCAKFFISGSSDQFNTPSKEIGIITRLNHPSILKFRGFSPKSNFAITEILIQNNLETVLNMSENDIPLTKWNDTNKLITIYGVASAMSHIHSEGIVYCCLTPRNILLDEKFHPKISDFSYAKQIDDDFNDAVMENHDYLAPEVITDNIVSKEGDVFSFGMMVYEIIFNKKPFKNPQTLRKMVIEGKRPELIGPIGDSFKKLIKKCWDENPSNRPSFDVITNQLFEDKGFITKSTNEKEFLNYAKPKKKHAIKPKTTPVKEEEKAETESVKKKPKDKLTITPKKEAKTETKASESSDTSKSIGLASPKRSHVRIPIMKTSPVIESESSDSDRVKRTESHKSSPKETKSKIKISESSDTDKESESESDDFSTESESESDESSIESDSNSEEHLSDDSSDSDDIYKKEIDKLSKKGDFSSLKKLGDIYSKGTYNCPINQKKASKYYLKASKKIHGKERYKLLKKAADLGSIEATIKYAHYQLENNKQEKAASYYKKAADKGNVEAMIKYAIMQKNGKGIKRNYREAMKYFKKAEEQGNSYAIYQHGLMLEYGNGVKTDQEKAVKYYKKAADEGNVEAMIRYAKLNKNGEVIEKDSKEAVKYFKKAAEQGNNYGIYQYGLMLEHGNGVKTDVKKAAKYIKIAADSGIIAAMINYARMLEKGIGIERDIDEALKYLKKGADRNDRRAKDQYNWLRKNRNKLKDDSDDDDDDDDFD